eukprot:38677-Eustigmatos_ZCMA.PRE.1
MESVRLCTVVPSGGHTARAASLETDIALAAVIGGGDGPRRLHELRARRVVETTAYELLHRCVKWVDTSTDPRWEEHQHRIKF